MLNHIKVRSVDREQLVHVAGEILQSLKGLDQANKHAGIIIDSNDVEFGQISFVGVSLIDGSYLILSLVMEKRLMGRSHYEILTQLRSSSDLSHQSWMFPSVSSSQK